MSEPRPGTPHRTRLLLGSMLALPAAVGVVLAAHVLEGGTTRALLQGAAGLIVGGGTLGAVLISYSPREVLRAFGAAASTFVADDDDMTSLTTMLTSLSIRAYRNGTLVLEHDVDDIRDPFLRNGLALVVDGLDPTTLRDVIAAEIRAREAKEDIAPRLFEAAAGYAPTFGILGAALGLMAVMRTLSEPGALGAGIAVAFVATVYGLGLANLLLLPLAGRLRERAAARARRREVILEAMVALQRRLHPRLFSQALRAMAPETPGIDAVVSRQPRGGLTAVGLSS